MKMKNIKYFSTLFVVVLAFLAGWWMWNYYMQSPWTRDGKVRAEVVDVAALVSGQVIEVHLVDNQAVKKGDLLFTIDPKPFQIEVDKETAAVATAKANSDKAKNEYDRRRNMQRSTISKEELDESEMEFKAMQAQHAAAQAGLEKAKWRLQQTKIYAPVDGYITKMKARAGRYALVGIPMVGVLDSDSFYVQGYFEETKLKHIQQGSKAEVVLYSSQQKLTGEVQSIGRAITDLNEMSDPELVSNVKPNVPWVRLAQRVPVKIKLHNVPKGIRLIAGTTCSISIQQ
ncbi:efflux RND transporter periplasmic adaptor subunit [Vibrio rumoiensis]|uniref:Efflux transporter periplasmic adaptor subunit n=1 Tax=Vibrio rumoiensis 1S-45 TaxID=1188252 RepID=A0A1E5E6T9_9VIBR|nr:HlyD family secretion protein [Vibrio rumoiensis]OEF30059.1 efflux transporter periplasmic adaptor subunit [Vibrio rumoiensis 1S-45]